MAIQRTLILFALVWFGSLGVGCAPGSSDFRCNEGANLCPTGETCVAFGDEKRCRRVCQNNDDCLGGEICVSNAHTLRKDQLVCIRCEQASEETCNGKDDDCDGRVDNVQGTSRPLASCAPKEPTRESTVDEPAAVEPVRSEPVQKEPTHIEPTRVEPPTTEVHTREPSVSETTSPDAGEVDVLPERMQTPESLQDTGDREQDSPPENTRETRDAPEPSCIPSGPEVCNGIDDDCSGTIDDGLVAPPCQKQQGSCAASTKRCGGGKGWLPCTTTDYLAHAPTYEPVERTCDGKDNDCDGLVDEGLHRSCYTGPVGSENVGICQGGTQTCQNGGWSSCIGEVLPQKEACDGKDTDCDGILDPSTCECLNGQKKSCYGGQAIHAGVGICQFGTTLCHNGKWGVCQGYISPKTETCNGNDDDCDGLIDESDPQLTQPCNVQGQLGVCLRGTYKCQNKVLTCISSASPTTEVCNGKDDDCNGKLDDIAVTSCSISGQQGICATGTNVCVGGQIRCEGTKATSETCNGKDDDCDGKTDEGLGWSCGTSSCPVFRTINKTNVIDLAYRPDGLVLMSAASLWSGEIDLWNPLTGQKGATLYTGNGARFRVAYAPNGKTFASSPTYGPNSRDIDIMDVASKSVLFRLTGYDGRSARLAYRSDGKRLVAVGAQAVIWDPTTGKMVRVLATVNAGFTGVVYTPNGQTIITSSYNKTIKFWNASTGAVTRTITSPKGPFLSLAISPDGKTIAAGYDLSVGTWDVATGKALRTMTGHLDGVGTLAFHKDNRTLAAGTNYYDQSIRVWDTQTGALLHWLKGHKQFISKVTFSPNGEYLATSSGDGPGQIILWKCH